MPTYEYECKDCGNRFEEFQSITSAPLTTCPKCNGSVVRIISGGAGFVFKGSGFYITENRSDKYKESAKKDSETTSKPKTDSKDSKKTTEKKSEVKKTKTESKKN